MTITVTEQPISSLADYARIPSAFEVREVLTVSADQCGLAGLRLTRQAAAVPYMKDYDAIPGNHPLQWGERFDLRRWGILAAWQNGLRVGGAMIAWDAADVGMLEAGRDLAVLWDLRVAPAVRRQGIGAALFTAATACMTARNVRTLKVETQNINVPACDFYAGQGCTLGAIDRFAYPEYPDEVRLLWYKDL